ncbi:MAG: hypothetical protein ABMA64_30235 [Myxococcota bacterium]
MSRAVQLVALASVVALAVSFGVFRIAPIDVPVHLVSGRILWTTGTQLTTNTLSWTYPDHPVDQQYPLYQVAVYLLDSRVGPWSLTVLCAASWAAAVLAWLTWSGWRAAVGAPAVWLFAVLGVQRHLVPRPEAFTVLGLGALLLGWEVWRTTRSRWALAAMVVTQWLMVNTLQMFVVGVALQLGLVLLLGVTRALRGRGWVDDADAALPLGPLVATVGASLAALSLSPNGLGVYTSPLALLRTVSELGTGSDLGVQSNELEPIWTEPIGFPVTLVLLAIAAVEAWRARGRWQLVELGVLAIGLAMVLTAMRGIPFFSLAAAAVATRWSARGPAWLPVDSPVHPTRAGLTAVVALGLLVATNTPQPYVYLQRQQGFGRSVGEWADTTTTFLRASPPPGEMMNLGWVAANYLTYGVYPVRRVFVDGRWEAYPMPFLRDCVGMAADRAALASMIEAWRPGFVVAEMRKPDQQTRLAELVLDRRATLVHVDSIAAVAVLDVPGAAAYAAAHPVELDRLEIPDWLPEHPVLHAQQQIRVGRLLRLLGHTEAADALFAAAARVDHPAVKADLATVTPSG